MLSLTPDDYAKWRSSRLGALTERLERALVLELLGDVRGLRVLDVGCGDGDLARELARRGASVVGIDAAPAMIDAAKHDAGARSGAPDYCVAAAQQLPFTAESFDAVVAVTILCFVADAEPVFGEMARVLRRDGRLVIGELGRWSTWAAARRVRAWLGSPLWKRGHFRTARELRGLAISSGLDVTTMRGAVFYPRSWCAAAPLSRADAWLGSATTVGAAFIALRAEKRSQPTISPDR